MLRSLKFTHKVMLAASLSLALVLGAFTLSNFLQMKDQVRTDLEHQLQALSESVSQNIADWLNAKMSIVQATAEVIEPGDSQSVIIPQLIQSRIAGDFKNVYLGLPDGTFVLDDPSIDLPADYDARQRPWYQLAVDQGSASFTEPYIDVTTNELTISAVQPVYDGQQLRSVVGGDIMLDSISAIVNNIDFMGLGYAFLVSSEGNILSHPDAEVVEQNVQQYLGADARIDREFVSYRLSGQRHLVSFVPVQGIPGVVWHLAIAVDEQRAFARVTDFAWTAILYMGLGVLAVIVLFSWLLRVLMKPLTQLNDAVRNLASGEGDLTQRLPVQGDDEFSRLSAQFNLFIEKIQHAMRDVALAARQVDENVSAMAEVTDQTLQMYDQQSERTDSVATAVNQLNSSANDIARSAADASQQASAAADSSGASRSALAVNIKAIHELSERMAESSDAIGKLDENTRNIGQILEVIKGVTEQTNLLALNAAIEAARAGEAGRGFAVVADEVRALAKRTQESASEIENMIVKLEDGTQAVVSVISQSQGVSEQCVESAQTSGDKMAAVDAAIAKIDTVNHSVAAATDEQTSVITKLDEDVSDIQSANQRGIQNLHQTRDACHKLRTECDRLERQLGRFKVE